MDKRRERRRLMEWGKDLLIVLLTCSAVWLTVGGQLLHPLQGALVQETPQPEAGQETGTAGLEAVRPLRITAVLSGGEGAVLRYGVQYDDQSCDALFQQTANLLAEALSGAEEPETVTRRQWEEALCTAPGLSFDFQGTIPFPVLTGWLTGEEAAVPAGVRRVLLTAEGGETALYFRDETTGRYFRCLSEMADGQHLADSLSALSGNGAFFAFESEEYGMLDADTLISAQVPVPRVYASSDPVPGGRSDLEALMEELGLAPNPNSYYYAGSAHVGRSGNDTIRLFDSGALVYESEEGSEHFHIPAREAEPTLAETVEACRRLTGVLTARCGQARLFLSAVTRTEEGLEVTFEYSLNGCQVRLEGGSAARFLVSDGQIVQFSMTLRSYSDSGETSVVMPYVQAAAAMEAQGLAGEELLLAYVDGGGDTVSAAWSALDGGI